MEFSFTPEQRMIQESAQHFLTQHSPSAAVRLGMATPEGFDPKLWRTVCDEMYWPALHIPEQYGGLGLGYVELAILFEQMGSSLLCSPYFSTIALATNALLIAGTEAQKQRYLPQIAEGRLMASFAYIGTPKTHSADNPFRYHNGWRTDDISLIAAPQINDEGNIRGYQLSGSLRYVPNGHTAELFIVAARQPNSTGEAGISLFLLPKDSQGLTTKSTPTLDQTRPLATLTLDKVQLPTDALMQNPDNAWPLLDTTLQLACVALAAEQVGGAQKALDLTLSYTQERRQFGRTIASFQAIKHRMADMMLQVESARSALYYAACIADEALNAHSHLADELPLASALAKAYCSDAYYHCAAESIQLHGGVGFTWEYDPHLYFKRAKSSESLLGSASFHREKIAQMILTA